MGDDPPGHADASGRSWREAALDRSLSGARDRSRARLMEIVGAARELAEETGRTTFTVAQVAERAGVSLKTLYRFFPGKDDLLLALLEEDSRRGATLVAVTVDGHDEAAQRLHAYVARLFSLMAAGDSAYVSVLVREYLRLAETRHEALRRAIAPLVDALTHELERARAVGAASPLDPARDARTVFDLAVMALADLVLAPEPYDATSVAELRDYVWEFVARALDVRPIDRTPQPHGGIR